MFDEAFFIPTKSEAVDISSADYTFTSRGIAGIYAGGAGNIVCRLAGDSVDRTWAVPAGSYLKGNFTKVTRTNTTATGLIGVILRDG